MKNSSSIIFGLATIIGFTILGLFILSAFGKESTTVENDNDDYRYELVPANENNIIIFDKKTGEYWSKFIPSDEGPTNWEKGDFPANNSSK
ncbi:hypothetical protein C2I06_02095 [Niallia circulans]|jgi:hypothetical protein|uniref:Uncharacterized protein n=1 Tax=Niallia circulans TaxID=1397 RepID=A0A268F7N3_NIACI|nr:hypothetical protein [Niallia circulans]AYV65756.1 hypothetical protein C2I06_02095 [Niallia circulans]NRG28590.1 hypothetical protein [Niallia circulans]PAD81391.1 hypothetical protein CHH57_20220 [Niallia circulans]QJX61649.1 hypothetical protein HLK66_08305 [Niallia circulans]